jgi:hypothetical protein
MVNPIMLINVLLVLTFFNYVYQLEYQNCGCSADWRRDFIKYYTAVIIYKIILYNIIVNYKNPVLIAVFNIFNLFTNLFGLVYLWSLFTYAKMLKKKQCLCSNTVSRKIMANYSLFMFVLIGIILINYFFYLIKICV